MISLTYSVKVLGFCAQALVGFATRAMTATAASHIAEVVDLCIVCFIIILSFIGFCLGRFISGVGGWVSSSTIRPLLCCKSNHIFSNKGCKRKESFVFLWFFLVFVDFSRRQAMGKQKVEAFPPRGLPPLFKYIWGFVSQNYIMPPIPGCAAGIIGSFSGLSTMRHSVVRNMPAMDAAFSRATRATLAGSMTPAARRSS